MRRIIPSLLLKVFSMRLIPRKWSMLLTISRLWKIYLFEIVLKCKENSLTKSRKFRNLIGVTMRMYSTPTSTLKMIVELSSQEPFVLTQHHNGKKMFASGQNHDDLKCGQSANFLPHFTICPSDHETQTQIYVSVCKTEIFSSYNKRYRMNTHTQHAER